MPNRKKIFFNSRTSKENCIPQTQLSGTTNYAVHIQPLSRQVAVQVLLTPDAVDTVLWADDVWRYRPKHVEQLTDLNKLYSVASCWIYIAILYDAQSIEHKKTLAYFQLYQIVCTQKKDKSNTDSVFRWCVLKFGVLSALRQASNTIWAAGMWHPTVLRNG